MTIYLPPPEQLHRCQRPDYALHPLGTVFHCDECGQWWLLRTDEYPGKFWMRITRLGGWWRTRNREAVS